MIAKRYSEMRTFHKTIGNELKKFMKKRGMDECVMIPEFPPKKLFKNKERKFIEKRKQ